MNDPKTLQIIAEKACQFDRAHFDDDEPTAVDSLLANHERLPTDRKLITRLRPRYAVALGFFEGYALAIEDNDELRSGPFIEHLRMLVEAKPHEGLLAALERIRRERDELQTKLVEAERIGAEHASQLEDEIRALVAERDRYKREATESKNQANIGIVIKPPPPPPPAAPPAPNELRTEISDELLLEAAEYANDFCEEQPSDDDLRDARRSVELKKFGRWSSCVRNYVDGAQRQLSRIENAHAGDDPTMHFPPAFDRASMPSDDEIARFCVQWIGPHWESRDLHSAQEDLADPGHVRSYATAMRAALIHFGVLSNRPANQVQDSERTQYETTIRQKNERIAELEKQLGFDRVGPNPIVFRDDAECDYWEEMSHVLASKPNTTSQSVATAADEMVEERRKRLPVRIVSENGSRPVIVGVRAVDEVTDELLLEAARFANESERFTSPADKLPPDRELECAKKAMREDCVMTWYRVCRAYVNGAQRSSRKP